MSPDDMKARCREMLRCFDDVAQRASAAHEVLVRAWQRAPSDRRDRLYARPIQDARFREGEARGAFEGARRLAEVLGLIAEGEREFWKGDGK